MIGTHKVPWTLPERRWTSTNAVANWPDFAGGKNFGTSSLPQSYPKLGYVMLVDLGDGHSLYVKLMLGAGGKVFGRSFHLSDR